MFAIVPKGSGSSAITKRSTKRARSGQCRHSWRVRKKGAKGHATEAAVVTKVATACCSVRYDSSGRTEACVDIRLAHLKIRFCFALRKVLRNRKGLTKS